MQSVQVYDDSALADFSNSDSHFNKQVTELLK